jgi:hypothetical protein
MKTRYERKLFCSYIWADGTLAQMFEEKRDGLKLGDTWDLTLGYCTRVTFSSGYRGFYDQGEVKTNGRIIIDSYSGGLLALLRGAEVTIVAPRFDAGSENTRTKGVKVGSLDVKHPKFGILRWHLFEDLISGPVTVQTDIRPVDAPADGWRVGHYVGCDVVMHVTDLRPKVAQSEVA